MSDAMDRVRQARLAIFDLDGTLFTIPVDWKPLRTRMIELCRQDGAGEGMARIRDAYEYAGDRPDLKARLVAMHEAAESAGRMRSSEVRAGTVLAKWRLGQGLPTAVLTMNTRDTAEYLLGGWGFSAIVTIEDVRIPKPHPEGLEIILSRLGMERSRTLMVGNSDYDRGAAGGAGIGYVDVTEL